MSLYWISPLFFPARFFSCDWRNFMNIHPAREFFFSKLVSLSFQVSDEKQIPFGKIKKARCLCSACNSAAGRTLDSIWSLVLFFSTFFLKFHSFWYCFKLLFIQILIETFSKDDIGNYNYTWKNWVCYRKRDLLGE